MLVIAGTITIDPAQHERAVAAAVEMMRETQKEPGCVRYVFSADLAERGKFQLFEEWASPEALQAHFRAPHMATFQKAIGQLGVRELAIERYEVSAKGAMRP
jgi:quinol monooxygenase YgiN